MKKAFASTGDQPTCSQAPGRAASSPPKAWRVHPPLAQRRGLFDRAWPRSCRGALGLDPLVRHARSEELEDKPTFRIPWKRGQRCIIPADWFDEPNWESGKNVWWRFKRADGEPWALAGLWDTWRDNETGEMVESYTMLTMHANSHPLMGRMHKPDVDRITKVPLPFEQQDKRSVIPIEQGDVDQWLTGSMRDAKALLRLAPFEVFNAGPSVPTTGALL